MAIDHTVQEPAPVLPRNIGDEPRVSFTMEPNFLCESALEEEIGYNGGVSTELQKF